MFGLFKSPKPPTTPTPSPVTGATSAAASPSFFNRVAKTLKGRPKPIPKPGNSHYPRNDNNIEAKQKIRERFDELYEEHRNSKDPRVKFLVNQLNINRNIFDMILGKDVINDNDVKYPRSFCKPLENLFKILIADETLATELENYNDFLNYNYSRGLRDMKHIKQDHARAAAKAAERAAKAASRAATGSRSATTATTATATASGTAAKPDKESPKDAEITQRTNQALFAMLSGLTDLPMMRANLQAKMARSKKQISNAYSEFNKASKAANATTAALVTGLGNALNGSSSGASGAAGTGLNGFTGLNLNLNEQTNAETQAVINQAVLASLPKFPQPPTTPPKFPGGGKRKTRSKTQRRNKTRKQRKERK